MCIRDRDHPLVEDARRKVFGIIWRSIVLRAAKIRAGVRVWANVEHVIELARSLQSDLLRLTERYIIRKVVTPVKGLIKKLQEKEAAIVGRTVSKGKPIVEKAKKLAPTIVGWILILVIEAFFLYLTTIQRYYETIRFSVDRAVISHAGREYEIRNGDNVWNALTTLCTGDEQPIPVSSPEASRVDITIEHELPMSIVTLPVKGIPIPIPLVWLPMSGTLFFGRPVGKYGSVNVSRIEYDVRLGIWRYAEYVDIIAREFMRIGFPAPIAYALAAVGGLEGVMVNFMEITVRFRFTTPILQLTPLKEFLEKNLLNKLTQTYSLKDALIVLRGIGMTVPVNIVFQEYNMFMFPILFGPLEVLSWRGIPILPMITVGVGRIIPIVGVYDCEMKVYRVVNGKEYRLEPGSAVYTKDKVRVYVRLKAYDVISVLSGGALSEVDPRLINYDVWSADLKVTYYRLIGEGKRSTEAMSVDKGVMLLSEPKPEEGMYDWVFEFFVPNNAVIGENMTVQAELTNVGIGFAFILGFGVWTRLINNVRSDIFLLTVKGATYMARLYFVKDGVELTNIGTVSYTHLTLPTTERV